jgi:hypothetical protein
MDFGGGAMEGKEGQVVGQRSIIQVLLCREVGAMEVLKPKVSPAQTERMRFSVTQLGFVRLRGLWID